MEEIIISDFIGELKADLVDHDYIRLSIKDNNSLTPHGIHLITKDEAKQLGEWLINQAK